jgi:hypothetical protein
VLETGGVRNLPDEDNFPFKPRNLLKCRNESLCKTTRVAMRLVVIK